ncbi:TIGR03767 family metallophosphoesterase [Streptomyces sodiiphilus]|uniref:TIGR03767 family metallophosphoesterase n=1 Tax=Streptomyces sodiiphilus TaxID=226217 RepID=A0ABP5A6B5_9ACTN
MRERLSALAAANRRTVLGALGGAVLGTAGAVALSGRGSPAEARDESDGRTPGTDGAHATGTTLEEAASGTGTGPYRPLSAGPGWTRVLRDDLAAPGPGREGPRTPLAAFVQFTDTHVTDVQHPLRLEYLRTAAVGYWRPHETLTVAGLASLVERVNALRAGPATGEPLGFVMTTGDNTDNNSTNELEWFLTAMNGGRITPAGDPAGYQGVQRSGLPLYWNPEDELSDLDKQLGFPRLEGFLDAALREVKSPGLDIPWYSTSGNHDLLATGVCADSTGYLAAFATGDRKLLELPHGEAATLYTSLREGGDPLGRDLTEVLRTHRRAMVPVTPDERRTPFTRREYTAAHLAARHTGPGPVGHGYTEDNLEQDTLYYTFRIADNVLGISMDTTNAGGHWQGSVGTGQLTWLREQLVRHADDHVLVFSHHASWSMTNDHPDPRHPGEERHLGEELIELFRRHPNVVGWISGHSHRNRIEPRGSFWEVSTASHIDYPQLARVIELAENGDGTLSLFTTLVESAAPYATDPGDLSQTGLAAWYRELAFNAPGATLDRRLGKPDDRNTELLLPGR